MTPDSFDHEFWIESAGAYVLRALPGDEEQSFERHLSTCATCRDQVEELRAATDALALAAPPMVPSANLRARVMQVVEQEAALLRAAGPEADAPARPVREKRRRFSLDWLSRPALAMPAMVVLLALGVLAGLAGGGALDAEPATRSVRAEVNTRVAPNARVTLEMKDGQGTLVAERLPEPPRGRVYQVWVKRPNLDPEPTSTLFAPRTDGSAAAAVPGSLDGMEAVIVTHEPVGGSPRPTSQPVLQVSPAA